MFVLDYLRKSFRNVVAEEESATITYQNKPYIVRLATGAVLPYSKNNDFKTAALIQKDIRKACNVRDYQVLPLRSKMVWIRDSKGRPIGYK
jgi:hypothetical protein